MLTQAVNRLGTLGERVTHLYELAALCLVLPHVVVPLVAQDVQLRAAGQQLLDDALHLLVHAVPASGGVCISGACISEAGVSGGNGGPAAAG